MKYNFILSFHKTRLALFFIFVAALYSCGEDEVANKVEKEEVANPTLQEEPAISVVNGNLKFSSEKAFQETIKQLSTLQNKDELDQWERQYITFVSMRTAFDQITEKDIVQIAHTNSTSGYDGYLSIVGKGDDKEALRNIDNPVLATLASKDGLVLIGNDAFKYNFDKLIVIKNFDNSKLEGIENVTQTDASKGIEVYPITRKVVGSQSVKFADGREVNCINSYKHEGALCCKKRLVGEIVATEHAYNSSYYQSISAITKHQTRTSGIWYLNSTPELTLQMNASLTMSDDDNQGSSYPTTFDYNNTEYNVSKVEKGEYYIDLDRSHNMISISSYAGFHKGVCDDNRFRECANTW